MACRTLLLRALQRLAVDQVRAERLGVDVEALAELPAERARLTRRQLLERAGAAGTAAALAPAVFARRARAGSGPRIAIVGGGIAGLGAALTLADRGVASTVYESSSRGRALPHRRRQRA